MDSLKVAVVPPDQLRFQVRNAVTPLQAASNRGVLLSYQGASQAVLIPIDKPVAAQASH